MNGAFAVGFFIALAFALYYLVRIIISAVKHTDKSPYLKGLGISVAGVVACFALFAVTETPEQKADTQVKIIAQL